MFNSYCNDDVIIDLAGKSFNVKLVFWTRSNVINNYLKTK
jgi:hypothetical protein